MAKILVNFSNPKDKRNVLETVRGLEGLHRMEWCKHRPRRTDRQNRWYWPCFVQPFAEWLSETQGHAFTDDQAHEIFKQHFLPVPACNPKDGEVIATASRSTTTLTTVEFNEYLEKCAELLSRICDIEVPEPSVYREKEPCLAITE